jgi:hypothetical protein
VLGGLAALATPVAVMPAMWSAVPAPMSSAGTPGQEACEERMELGDPILRDVHRDLLVIGWG